MKKSTIYLILGGLAVLAGGIFVYKNYFSSKDGYQGVNDPDLNIEPVGGKRVELQGAKLRESGAVKNVTRQEAVVAGERFKKGIDKLAQLG